jgi:hypothetical protein
MGSGETAPTMVSVHADLMARMGPPPVPAVLLDTPFGFQENADDISQRAMAFFRDNVGFPITVATYRRSETATPLEYETMLARVGEARYVFAGPGSPTYALRQWRESALPKLLTVYEVYKVGEPPRWLEGLDLLSATGLRAAVIPHYNNAEGGTHDTRYCYMGERRLRVLEEMLPDDVSVLGVDEHTACIFDLDMAEVTIRGRGAVTWRHRGASKRFESGTVLPIEALAAAIADAPAPLVRQAAATEVEQPARTSAPSPFLEELEKHEASAEQALAGRDVDATVAAALAIDTQMHEWAADTFDSDEQDRAREALRRILVRLGDVARNGARDPRERIAPVVDRVLDLRKQMRTEGQYALADRLRDLLVDAGVEVRDSPDGSTWHITSD